METFPTLAVAGRTLPEAWEKAVLACWREGVPIKTEYDKPGDPPSRDCTMVWTVEDPFAEPRIHRAFPGGLEDLEVYRKEVVEGVHDHWICPEEGKWTYTYHKRLFAYDIEGVTVDQIAAVVDRLAKTGHTRRAQAITWNPKLDARTDDPALPPEALVPHARGRRGRARPQHEFPLAVPRRLQSRLHERLRPDRPPARRRRPRGRKDRAGRARRPLRRPRRQLPHLRVLLPRIRGVPEDGRKTDVRGAHLAERLRRADVRRGPRAPAKRKSGGK